MEGEAPDAPPPVAEASEDSALDVTYRITFYADAVEGESATPIQLIPESGPVPTSRCEPSLQRT